MREEFSRLLAKNIPKNQPTIAMILAAGRGMRMRPLTDQTPKPLLQVAGKSLIAWQIERLVAAGIRNIVINHAYLGEQIVQALGDGAAWGAQIRYSAESPEAALETGGGIRYALPFLGEQPFLVVNADIWSEIDYRTLTLPVGAKAHLIMVPNPCQHPEGDFHLTPYGAVTTEGNPRYTFSGVAVYQPALFRELPMGSYPLAPILRQAADAGQVTGTYYAGYWSDIGTPQRLEALRHRVEKVQNCALAE
jgi:MurNAc alpha-1-phosphate uridylyltransferase